jgi:hypothetical protein
VRAMNRIILYRREFRIIKINTDYILYNVNKSFNNGHTHLKSFNACISIIKLIEKKELPYNRNRYFTKSILRVSNDTEYNEKLNDLKINFKELMEEKTSVDTNKCR